MLSREQRAFPTHSQSMKPSHAVPGSPKAKRCSGEKHTAGMYLMYVVLTY